MKDEAREEQAGLYALGLLDEPEAGQFRAAMQRDSELQVLVDEFQESAAALVRTLPRAEAPAGVLFRVLGENRAEAPIAFPRETRASSRHGWSWALAASVVLGLGLLALNTVEMRKAGSVLRARHAADEARNAELVAKLTATEAQERALSEKIDALTAEQRRFGENLALLETTRQGLLAERDTLREQVKNLQTRDALSQVKIATLKAQVDAYARVIAVAVWDPERQSGVMTVENLPRPVIGKDYQLWVIDPRSPAPVSAGVMPSGDGESLRVAFKPARHIGTADKFAVSVENKGGSPTPQGPIVLLSK